MGRVLTMSSCKGRKNCGRVPEIEFLGIPLCWVCWHRVCEARSKKAEAKSLIDEWWRGDKRE